MVELLIGGIVLFIVAVAGLMLYDKHQENMKSRPQRPKFPGPETTPAPRRSRHFAPKTEDDWQQVVDMLNKRTATDKTSTTKVTINGRDASYVKTIEQLIAEIEKLKRR